MHFDFTTIITGIGGAVLGIGGVATFLGKYLPVTKKYIGIAGDALSLANTAIKAVEDKNITAEEIEAIKQAAIKLEADFKA